MAATTTPRRRLVAAAVLLLAVFEGNLLYEYAYRSENLHHVDLPSFWAAARLTFIEGRSPYDYDRMKSHAGEIGRHVFPFLYPPVSLLPFYPLKLTSWPAAATLVLASPFDLWWTGIFDVRPSLGYGLESVHLFSPACASNQSLNAVVSRLFLPPDCLPLDAALPLGGRWITYAVSLGIAGASLVGVAKAHSRRLERAVQRTSALWRSSGRCSDRVSIRR